MTTGTVGGHGVVEMSGDGIEGQLTVQNGGFLNFLTRRRRTSSG
jgi:hypothetical protein